MKGVVLAGGLGTRLAPLTKITNKHLLPVYDKPMIYYPIETLVRAGIRDIMIVTGGTSAGDFLRLLGNGKEFGLQHLHYTYQEGEGGIAEALGLCAHFVDRTASPWCSGTIIIEGTSRPRWPRSRSSRGARACSSRRFRTPNGSACRRSTRRPNPAHRRETEGAAEPLRSDRHLLLRRRRLRDHPNAPALRARRAGDHRREQRVHRSAASSNTTSSMAGGPTRGRSSRSTTPASSSARRAGARASTVTTERRGSALPPVGEEASALAAAPAAASTSAEDRRILDGPVLPTLLRLATPAILSMFLYTIRPRTDSPWRPRRWWGRTLARGGRSRGTRGMECGRAHPGVRDSVGAGRDLVDNHTDVHRADPAARGVVPQEPMEDRGACSHRSGEGAS